MIQEVQPKSFIFQDHRRRDRR